MRTTYPPAMWVRKDGASITRVTQHEDGDAMYVREDVHSDELDKLRVQVMELKVEVNRWKDK